MRTNLFKKIFTKHLHKGKEPVSTFIDDIGALKGILTLKEFKKNGQFVKQTNFNNMIVNQSKSSIIRLLSQGVSNHMGTIDPNDYVISKMRFSNDNGNGGTQGITSIIGPDKLEYYSLTEPSNRVCADPLGFAGGKQNTTILTPSSGGIEDFKHTFAKSIDNIPGLSGYTSASDGGKIFDLKSGFKVPSHGSVKVDFYKDFGGTVGEVKIESHFYNYGEVNSPNSIIYTRAPFANKPWKIENYLIDLGGVDGEWYFHISTPMSANVVTITDDANRVRTTTINTTNSTDPNYTGTRIYFDYTTGVEGWKIYLEEIANDAVLKDPLNTKLATGNDPHPTNNAWSRVVFNYTLGLYNVVNLIVPVSGYNAGVGTSILTRYNSNIDYYNVVTPSYQDCADDYIDDYAVTFTTSMPPASGNGDATGDGKYIQYRKAFLFSKNDEMFSSIVFPSTEFQKDPSNSFQISWKILAPIN